MYKIFKKLWTNISIPVIMTVATDGTAPLGNIYRHSDDQI